MKIVDGILWVSLGFIPMMGALELTRRLASRKLNIIREPGVSK